MLPRMSAPALQLACAPASQGTRHHLDIRSDRQPDIDEVGQNGQYSFRLSLVRSQAEQLSSRLHKRRVSPARLPPLSLSGEFVNLSGVAQQCPLMQISQLDAECADTSRAAVPLTAARNMGLRSCHVVPATGPRAERRACFFP